MESSQRGTFALRLWRVAMPIALIGSALSLVDTTQRLEGFYSSPYPLSPTLPYSNNRLVAAPSERGVPDALLDEMAFPVSRDMQRGQTLGGIFRTLGLPGDEAAAAVKAVSQLVDVRRIRQGCRYSAYYDADAALCDFELALADEGRLRISRTSNGWEGVLQPYERRTELRRMQGTLDGDLESSIRRAGGDPAIAYRMADVLEFDLDFTRDLRAGDRFEVLYEEVLLDGRPYGLGSILAMRYDNRGRTLEAYRYGENGYYDAEGRPLRKMFLRSPMPYSRITSRFSHRRYHPVLKSYRPHYGVDYGAPTGTPVRVTANGVVDFVGWDRGGGKTVKVRHSGDYVTAYLHLSRYASGLKRGGRVSQGEIVGYVGSTGLASGPHLDYRVKHRGNWIDPLTLHGQRDETIPARQIPQFIAMRDTMRATLRGGDVAAPPATALAQTRGVATASSTAAGALARR